MWLKNYYPFMFGNTGDKSSRQMRKYAQYENNRQWQDVFNRLVSVAVNIFEWENLPETCDPYFMEILALWRGNFCIINDTELGGYLSLPTTAARQRNIYYENSVWRATSLNYSKEFLALTKWNKDIIKNITVGLGTDVSLTGCVCHDNIMDYPLIETISIYTDKIVDVMRAIDVAQRQLKLGSLIETDEETKLSIQKAIEMVDTNVLAVYARRDIAKAIRESKSIPTGATSQTLVSLWDDYNNLMSAFLTAFGINNLNTADKKERLLTDEVNSNNEQIQLNAAYRLDQRLHFCENINSVYGLNISCKLKHDFSESSTSQKVIDDSKQKGGNEE